MSSLETTDEIPKPEGGAVFEAESIEEEKKMESDRAGECEGGTARRHAVTQDGVEVPEENAEPESEALAAAENRGKFNATTVVESSGKIDPDGSTDCLSRLAAPIKPIDSGANSHAATQSEEDEAEEASPVEGKGLVADEEGKELVDGQEKRQKVESGPPMSTTESKAGKAEAVDEQVVLPSKEAVDAPSVASDPATESATAEDKDNGNHSSEKDSGDKAPNLADFPRKSEAVVEEVKKVSNDSDETDYDRYLDYAQEDSSERNMDGDASGRIARTNSQPEPEVVERDAGEASLAAEADFKTATLNGPHFSAGTKSPKSPMRPMDASGRRSLDLERQQKTAEEVMKDPIGDHGERAASNSKEDPELNDDAASSEVHEAAELHAEPSIATESKPVPTPTRAMEKEASDAAIKAATELPPEEVSVARSLLSTDLLANKDKEGFGLLARGESFKGANQQHQQQAVPQLPHSDHPFDNTNAQSRVPQDPAAAHRREPSSIASTSRRNSGRAEEFNNENIQRMVDDSSHRPLDDNSWRPSQISYPSSPQGLPAPQAIPLNNGGYMVMPPPQISQMPQHQGQPPHAFIAPPPNMLHHQSSFHSQQSQLMPRTSWGNGYQAVPGMAPVPAMAPMPSPTATAPGGKRKIRLKLQEEILARSTMHNRRSTFFFGRSTRKLVSTVPISETEKTNEVDRGTITVSWFEGTSSLELQEHVNKSVERKLKLEKDQQLDDIRILDTKVDPPEEIVLCPYIPSGSEFVLRYKLKPLSGRATPSASPTFYGPPDSPSAAPSPFPSHGNLGGLEQSQLAALRKQLDSVQEGEKRTGTYRSKGRHQMTPLNPLGNGVSKDKKSNQSPKECKGVVDSDASDGDNESATLKPESSVDAKLRQITELLLMDKQKQQQYRYPRVEKRQVVFVLANYFVLFVAFITILAEMQARAPEWLNWMENQLENVQNCSADQEALFKCVSNGEFAGLFATVILWLSRSATTKQIFLLGFDSPQKLWTVFYESLVGAFCWGVSYMFIRRGMNPDTRPQFLQKYWKDAVYGSLAGFNATFMKAVLKNLIPREAVEEAFNDRQLKILSWLPTFS